MYFSKATVSGCGIALGITVDCSLDDMVPLLMPRSRSNLVSVIQFVVKPANTLSIKGPKICLIGDVFSAKNQPWMEYVSGVLSFQLATRA